MPIQVPTISIDMMTDPPRMGATQVNFRVTTPDKNLLDHAAIALGLTQAEFLRQVGIKAARFVLRERDKILGEDAPKDGLVKLVDKVEAMDQAEASKETTTQDGE